MLTKATTELAKAHQHLQTAKSLPQAATPATKFNEKMWRTTKIGDRCVHPITGLKYVWCALGHRNGSYMPEGHNHEAWEKNKKEKNAKWEESKKRKGEEDDRKPAAKKGGALKLSPDVQQAYTTVQNKLMENWHFSEHDRQRRPPLGLTLSLSQKSRLGDWV